MKKLRPELQKRADAVKAAHAHLVKSVPGFSSRHPHERIKMTQAHVKKTGC